MKKNWVGWVFAFLFMSALGIFAFQSFQIWKAVQSGESSASAFQSNQQKFWHVLLNPWVFSAYLAVLVVLLWKAARTVARKQHQANDLWILGALLAAIGVLVFRFIQGH